MAERCMEIRGNPGQYTQSPFWSRPSEIVFECAVPYFPRFGDKRQSYHTFTGVCYG